MGIGQSKWYYHKLIVTISSLEGSFVDVFTLDSDLMVSRSQVNL
jgi:hypothetical protein